MILVDSSIWIDHLRHGNTTLSHLLGTKQVLSHPFVIGEVALGNAKKQDLILSTMTILPKATEATDDEVLGVIRRHGLSGSGIGYVDAHLLAAVQLTRDALLWTRDKRLHTAAEKLNLSISPAPPRTIIH